MGAESKIQKSICDLLLFHPNVVWAYVTSTGTFRGIKGGRPIKIGYPGMADIIGQLTDGRMLAIEVKQPGKTPTQQQMEFLDLVRHHNGVSGWCDSIEGAKAIIDNMASDKAL
jgi:hypothetical protein